MRARTRAAFGGLFSCLLLRVWAPLARDGLQVAQRATEGAHGDAAVVGVFEDCVAQSRGVFEDEDRLAVLPSDVADGEAAAAQEACQREVGRVVSPIADLWGVHPYSSSRLPRRGRVWGRPGILRLTSARAGSDLFIFFLS